MNKSTECSNNTTEQNKYFFAITAKLFKLSYVRILVFLKKKSNDRRIKRKCKYGI